MALKTDYKDYIPPSGGRKYKITANSDGSSSVEDITQYQQVGDTWGAEDINQVNKLVNGAVYPNLLDNSNFTNPVNQRDGTSYSASTGNAAYAIDRWRIEGATYTVATHTLSGTSYTNRACRMAQFIEMAQYGLNIGDDMTFSIMANGTKHSATAKILDRDQYSSFENVPSAYSCDDFDIVLCTGLGKPSSEPPHQRSGKMDGGKTAMNRTVLVLMMAVTVEALVEYAKTFGKAILEKQWKTAATQAGAVALGVLLCFGVGADFYAALGVNFNVAWLGIALTGVFASRGANYVSDLVKKLQALGAAKTE